MSGSRFVQAHSTVDPPIPPILNVDFSTFMHLWSSAFFARKFRKFEDRFCIATLNAGGRGPTVGQLAAAAISTNSPPDVNFFPHILLAKFLPSTALKIDLYQDLNHCR